MRKSQVNVKADSLTTVEFTAWKDQKPGWVLVLPQELYWQCKAVLDREKPLTKDLYLRLLKCTQAFVTPHIMDNGRHNLAYYLEPSELAQLIRRYRPTEKVITDQKTRKLTRPDLLALRARRKEMRNKA